MSGSKLNQQDNKVFLEEVERVGSQLLVMIEGNLKVNHFVRNSATAAIRGAIELIKSWLRFEATGKES